MKKIFLLICFSLIFFSCENSSKATKFYLDAIQAFNENDFEKSAKLTKLSLKEKSNFFQAEFLQAKIYFFQKDYLNAEKIFCRLSKKQKENFDCKLWLLRTYFFEEKFNEAKNLLSKLTILNTEDWRLYYWKAQLAKQGDDFESYFLSLTAADDFLKNGKNVYVDLAVIWHELGLAEKSSFYYAKAQSITKEF